MDPILTYDFQVEPFSEDCRGNLSWGVLGNLLLRAASLHAGAHGFGYEQMIRTGHVWVLSRLCVDMERMPRTGERFAVSTWVSALYRQFTDRLFTIAGADGTPCGHARSTWALISTDTRRPMPLSDLPGGGFSSAVIERDVPIAPASRPRGLGGEPAATRRAGYTDLDINGHVNSIRYLEMALDLFGPERYATGRCRRLEAAYAAEAYMGEELRLFREELAPQTSAVEIRSAAGRSLVRILAGFEAGDCR